MSAEKAPVHVLVRPEVELVELKVGDPNGGPEITVELAFGDFLEISATVIQCTVARAREAAAARAPAKDTHVLELPVKGLYLPDGSVKRVS